MAAVTSGSFNTTGYSDAYSPDYYTFSWSLTSQSIVDNTSTISWSVVAAGGATSGYYNTVRERYVTVYGVTKSASDAQVTYNGTKPFSGTSVIKHDTNGNGSFSASCGGAFEVGGSYNSTGSGTWTLPTIARSTTPTYSATSVEIGKSITITLNPATSSFKHKVSYAFGNLTDQTSGVSIGSGFSAAGNVTVTLTPPTSLGSQIPSATSGVCKVTCSTYTSAGALVGSVTSNITLTIPSYTPTVTGITLTGSNLLSSTYVQGKSTVTVAATVGTSYGATTKSISTVIDGKTYSGLPLTTGVLSTGSKTAQITFTDTRDKSVTVTSSAITVYEYSIPNITDFTLARQSDGTTVIATVKGSIASINSKNAKTIKVTLNGVTNTITSSSYTISGTTTFTGVSTDQTFSAKAVFTDSYVSIERTAILPTVAVTMDFYKDGKGIAFGKVAEVSGLLDVSWDMRVNGNINGVSISPDSYMNGGSKENITDEGWVADVPTFIGTYSQNDVWYNTISLRHRNGVGDGKKYGLQIRDELTRENSLSWRQHINGSWKDWRKLIDSKNIGDYVTTPADYVVEQGTSTDGMWTYRKWNSGIAECWGIYTMASSCTLAWGTLYYSNKTTPRINYPFTFKSRPQETVSLRLDSYSGWIYADSEGKGMNTTTQTAVYGFLRPTTMGETTIRYEFTVIGKWK